MNKKLNNYGNNTQHGISKSPSGLHNNNNNNSNYSYYNHQNLTNSNSKTQIQNQSSYSQIDKSYQNNKSFYTSNNPNSIFGIISDNNHS